MVCGHRMDDRTATAAACADLAVYRRVLRFQILTVVWMSVEVVIALTAAWSAKSPALLGFGGDSFVELLPATIVLWRFRSRSDSTEKDERLAARLAGVLLFTVAGFVALISGLSLLGYNGPKPSPAGIELGSRSKMRRASEPHSTSGFSRRSVTCLLDTSTTLRSNRWSTR